MTIPQAASPTIPASTSHSSIIMCAHVVGLGAFAFGIRSIRNANDACGGDGGGVHSHVDVSGMVPVQEHGAGARVCVCVCNDDNTTTHVQYISKHNQISAREYIGTCACKACARVCLRCCDVVASLLYAPVDTMRVQVGVGRSRVCV